MLDYFPMHFYYVCGSVLCACRENTLVGTLHVYSDLQYANSFVLKTYYILKHIIISDFSLKYRYQHTSLSTRITQCKNNSLNVYPCFAMLL